MAWPAIIAGAAAVIGSLISSGGSSTSIPVKEQVLTEEQMALVKQMAEMFSEGMEEPVETPEMATPTTGAEQEYLDFVGGLGESKALQQLATGEVPYEVGPRWAEEYYEKGLKPSMMREYEQVARPALREAFAGPGYHGTARMRAETEQAADLATELGLKKHELMYGEEKAAREAKESAMSRVLGATETLGGQYKEAGGLEREVAQEETMANLMTYLMGGREKGGAYSAAYNPNVRLAMNLLGISPYQVGTQTESSRGLFG